MGYRRLQAATVKGSVVDATGEPVIGASILVGNYQRCHNRH